MVREDRARAVDLTFEIRLDGPGGGVWTVRMHDGTCTVTPGFAEGADVRYTADAKRLVRRRAGAARRPRGLQARPHDQGGWPLGHGPLLPPGSVLGTQSRRRRCDLVRTDRRAGGRARGHARVRGAGAAPRGPRRRRGLGGARATCWRRPGSSASSRRSCPRTSAGRRGALPGDQRHRARRARLGRCHARAGGAGAGRLRVRDRRPGDRRAEARVPAALLRRGLPRGLAGAGRAEAALRPGPAAHVAEPKGDDVFVLSGAKSFVPLGDRASHFLVVARNDGAPRRLHRAARRRGADRLRAGEEPGPARRCPRATLELERVEVPLAARLGGADGCDVQRMRTTRAWRWPR